MQRTSHPLIVIEDGDQAGNATATDSCSQHTRATAGAATYIPRARSPNQPWPAQPAFSTSPRPGTRDARRTPGQPASPRAASSYPYIPFDPQAANLMFMLVSRRYERASLIVTSNKPFSGWGEIF